MVKIKDTVKREVYSIRLNPEVVTRLKHVAVDEKKALSELVEEGIMMVLEKYRGRGQ